MGIAEAVSRKVSGIPRTRTLGKSVVVVAERPPGGLEASGAAGGARTAQTAFIDENMGGTVPPGLAMLEQRGASEVAGLWAAFERAFATDRKRLRRRGARLSLRRRRLEASEIASIEAAPTENEETPAETRRVALGFWVFLGFMAIANAGLDLAIFEVLGMPMVTTGVLAIAIGAAQTIALFSAGGKVRDLYANKATPGKVVVAIEIVGAVAVGLAAAYLRAYRLIPLPGLQLRIPGFWAAFAVFGAFALAVEAAIFALGFRFAADGMRAQLVRLRKRRTAARQLHRAERRFEAQKGRFHAGVEHAQGQISVADAVIDRALADSLGAVAAFFEEACIAADAGTGAELGVMAEERISLLDGLREAGQNRLAAARAVLTTVVHTYDPNYMLVEPEDLAGKDVEPEVVEPEVVEPEAVTGDAVASDAETKKDAISDTVTTEASNPDGLDHLGTINVPDRHAEEMANSSNGHGPAANGTVQDASL